MNVGKAIREIRKSVGLSQVELATAAGITQAALSGIENGNRPAHESLRKICNALSISESLVYVMGMEKEDVPVSNRALYDQLYPVIVSLIMKVASPDPVQ
jgi:transcriptional regulator with XRE-family HTH domain